MASSLLVSSFLFLVIVVAAFLPLPICHAKRMSKARAVGQAKYHNSKAPTFKSWKPNPRPWHPDHKDRFDKAYYQGLHSTETPVVQTTPKPEEKSPAFPTTPKPEDNGPALGPWTKAHATFYGEADGVRTMGGACGYEDVLKEGFGTETAALSTALFNNGASCGACYEMRCVDSDKWCNPGQPALLVTATNFCPPNYGLSSDAGGWCNPPREHFDLSMPAFLKIAQFKAGIIPVEYRRVPCKKQGGIRFTVRGNPWFDLILVENVGGAGDVKSVEVRGNEKDGWAKMNRNWGQVWQTTVMLVGEPLSFRVTTSDGKTVTSMNVAPSNWQYGQTFEGQNFVN